MEVERVDYYNDEEYQRALQEEEYFYEREQREMEAAQQYEHKDDAPVDPPDDREISNDEIPF